MDGTEERFAEAYATLVSAVDAAMDVIDRADYAVNHAHAATLAADRAAQNAADARRDSRKVRERLNTAMGILRPHGEATP